MPSWSPEWEDVAFDHARAADAADALRSAAGTTSDVRHAMPGAAGDATEDWDGELVGDFTTEEAAVGTRLEGLREELVALAARIEAGSEDAHAEQRRREAGRERWLEEVREEAAREEAARAPAPTGPR